METDVRAAAIIPALNADPHIAGVIDRVSRHVPRERIIIVDDGSRDDTRAVAEAAGVEVVVHAENRGKGEALKSGFARARELGCEVAVCLDADGQHNPDEIPRFLECYARGGAEVVVGNRMTETADMPWLRKVTNHVTSAAVSLLAGRGIPDSQNGYRLVALSLFDRVRLETSRYETESEMLIKAGRAGAKIDSVPIQTIYGEEHSAINPFVDTGRFLRMVLKSFFW